MLHQRSTNDDNKQDVYTTMMATPRIVCAQFLVVSENLHVEEDKLRILMNN